MQFLDLPFEIILKILSLLSPIELSTCQLVNKYLNVIISKSLTLQYRTALELAKADDNPCSVVSLPQKLEEIQSSEAAWATLQPNFIVSLPVKHRTSGIYDLSAGTYLLGNADRMALQYLRLPTQADDPLNWRKITLNKTIIDMGFCVFEHDLIAIFTSTPSTTQTDLLDIEMTLLEYSTGRPHPRAKNSAILVMSSSTPPALMCEIVGENLVLILNFPHAEDRIFIWNWHTSVLKTAFLAPCHTYSGILFLEEDLIILPNAVSSAFDFFRIPKKPTDDAPKPVLSLQLPSLTDGMEINQFTCRAEPNPIPDISRLNKRQRAQERSNAGIAEVDPLAPKRGFLASAEDAICIFQIGFRNRMLILQGGIHFETTGRSYTLFVHRSSFLNMARQYGEDQVYEGAVDSRKIPWVDWGPPVSRWFNANATPTRWITTSAGQRCVVIHEHGVYGSPITLLDFNSFNVRKMKAKLKRENEKAKEKFHWESNSTDEAMAVEDCQDMPADEEHLSLLASETGEPSYSISQTQNKTMIIQETPMKAISIVSDDFGEMDVVEDDDDETWVSMEDDVHVDADSDDSIPGLESVASSDDETDRGYSQKYLHPGLALCRVFEAPSSVESPGAFAEEVEGRLPYVAYVSEREYEYDGVLLDEERLLGITTDDQDRISAIDIFYFG